MTSYKDGPGKPGTAARQPEPGGTYVAYETEDGAFVIRDESAPDAWIRSDTVVELKGHDD
jgi:hypothetical protein